jgi:hypothetical protein
VAGAGARTFGPGGVGCVRVGGSGPSGRGRGCDPSGCRRSTWRLPVDRCSQPRPTPGCRLRSLVQTALRLVELVYPRLRVIDDVHANGVPYRWSRWRAGMRTRVRPTCMLSDKGGWKKQEHPRHVDRLPAKRRDPRRWSEATA